MAQGQTQERQLKLMFFVSGATALVYQVVWTRLLTLFFGSTTLAVSTVLAVFMAGLAIGSALLGRKADIVVEPIRFYGRLELAIGVLAIATPLTFAGIERLFTVINDGNLAFWPAAMLRFGLSSLLLLPPTILMGGTLPVLSKVFLKARGTDTGRSISMLYFINTAGAVVGTLAAGLFLLQLIGIRWLLVAGGLLNLAIFVFAYRMTRPPTPTPTPAEATDASDQEAAGAARWSRNAVVAVVVLFLSGLAALIYEVAWARVLTLVIGSSTYAFTIMLATFLIGIALGSAAIGRYAAGRKPGLGLLGVCQILAGVFALGTATLFGFLPDAFVALFGAVGEKFSLFMVANFALCFLVMVPATLFMGASFPVASALVVESFGTSGRRIGLLYAGNTVGAIVGAFLAGFVLLPGIGIQSTLIVTVFVNLACGLALSLLAMRGRTGAGRLVAPGLTAAVMLLLAFVWQPPWDKLKMTSGPYAYAVQYQRVPIESRLAGLELLFYREGPIATVSVVQEGKHVRLAVDGKTDAGNFRDMTTQVLAGHLPLLVKPDARDVLVIGYASGITVGATARHPVRSLDCIEIEPAMRDASRFFEEENFHVITDPRFSLVIDDARSRVLAARKKYDVIISEPSNPWQSGSSRLFTREAFENGRNSLKPGGVMAQWMHLYGVDVDTFRLVVRTFMTVFPHTTVWVDPDFADVIFLGSTDPIRIDPVTLDRTYKESPGVAASLARIGYAEPWSLFKAFALGEEDARRFAGTGELNTDNLPLLEFRAPRSLYSKTALPDNLRAMRESRAPDSFPAVAFGPGDEAKAAGLLTAWGKSLAERGMTANARGALSNAVALDPSDIQAHFYLALVRMHSGDGPGAIASFERAKVLQPTLGAAFSNLGALYLQAGQLDKAYDNLQQALVLGEDSSGLRNNLAVVFARSGRLTEAAREARLAVKLDPGNRTARENLDRFEKMQQTAR